MLVFTADGKGVPLVKADAQRVPAFDKAERPGNRRMATLAAVYTIDPYVRTPEQIVAALFRDDAGPRPKDRPQPRFKHVTARFTRMREDPDGEPWESNGTIEAFAWARRTNRRPPSSGPEGAAADGWPSQFVGGRESVPGMCRRKT